MPSEEKDEAKDESKDCDAIEEETPAPAPPPTDCTIVVAGLADDVKLSKAAAVGEGDLRRRDGGLLRPERAAHARAGLGGLPGREERISVGGKCSGHAKSPLVLIEWEGAFHYVGGDRELEALATEELGRAPAPPDNKALDASTHARYLEMLNATGHQFVFLDVQFNANTQNNKPRKVVLELCNQLCPKTCFNFRALTTGELGKREAECHGEKKELLLHYRGAPFHRVVPGGWVQSGDIFDGSGGSAKIVEDAADENFAVKFDAPGVLAMANDGAHTNNTQFFITLNALDWLDKTAVAFGRVVKGMATIRQIGALPTKNERPVDDCKIHNCGIINLKDGFGLG
ncbi:peptidyl-prolyl cis-trans isomerase [Aureococcus anophagefferens]|nr:peptidyl-prolyl cis-trans isomerase [Aureococcus anophagefferens]